MDLRICPACSQSVLDDDVAECPFCGAAMDGSSGSTKTSAPAKKTILPTEQTAAKPGRPTPKAVAAGEESRILVSEKPTKTKTPIIALRPKPTAKTMHRVVCPMCDTNGFGTTAVAGKEVKCPNPKCLMPIFTAPELPKVEPVKPKKNLVTPLNIFLAVSGLAAIGAGIFFAVLLNGQKQPQPPLNPNNNNLGNNTIPVPELVPDNEQPPPAAEVKPKIPRAEWEKQVMQAAIEAARQRSDNRSKEFCRVLNSAAFASRGDLEGAYAQLLAFDNLNSGLNFMKIAPLCEIAWHHWKKGDRAAAEKVIEQAVEYSARLPKNSTDADVIRQAVILGTLLIATEKYTAARELIESRENVEAITQSVARISMVIEDQTYNLDNSYQWLPEVTLAAPLAFAVTYGAVMQGFESQARDWVNQITSAERRGTCLAGWAVAVANRDDSTSVDLSPIPQVLPLERIRAQLLACQSMLQNEQKLEAGKKLAQETATELKTINLPDPVTLPDFRTIYEGKFSSAGRETEIGVQCHLLQAKAYSLMNLPELSQTHLELAFRWAASLAPMNTEVTTLVNFLEKNRSQLESELSATYQLERDDQRRNAFNQYRKNLRQVEQATADRFAEEKIILELAIQWQLTEPLSAILEKWAANQDQYAQNLQLIAEINPTPLFHLLNSSGKTELLEQLNLRNEPGVSRPQLEQQLDRLLAAGNIDPAIEMCQKNRELFSEPLFYVRKACRLADSTDAALVIAWAAATPDSIEREISLRLTGAQLAMRGLFREYWESSLTVNLSATEKCALIFGLVNVLKSLPPEPVAPAETDKKTPAQQL